MKEAPKRAGRKLDAWIAEHLMGWGEISIDRNGNPVGIDPFYPTPYRCHIVPNYSTNLQDAWLVIGKLETLELMVVVRTYFGKAGCEISPDGTHNNARWFGSGADPALAICLAAASYKSGTP